MREVAFVFGLLLIGCVVTMMITKWFFVKALRDCYKETNRAWEKFSTLFDAVTPTHQEAERLEEIKSRAERGHAISSKDAMFMVRLFEKRKGVC